MVGFIFSVVYSIAIMVHRLIKIQTLIHFSFLSVRIQVIMGLRMPSGFREDNYVTQTSATFIR
jgi:hypothetical protein